MNTPKSNCMLICTYQKRQHLETDQLTLYLYDTLLKNVESQKILGLHIDKNLTWKIHIDNLCKEVSKLIGLLWRNKHILPYSCRLLFYKAYILPKIDFCLTIWGKSSQTFLDRIWKLQKRAIRIVCDLPYSEPTRHVFSALNFITFMKDIFIICASLLLKLSILIQHPYQSFLNITVTRLIIYVLTLMRCCCIFHFLEKRFISNRFLIRLPLCGINCQIKLK